MKNYNKVTKKMIEENVGKYIRFEGYGLIEDFEGTPYRQDCYENIGYKEDVDGIYICRMLILRKYGGKKTMMLPEISWNQKVEIYDDEERRKMDKRRNE